MHAGNLNRRPSIGPSDSIGMYTSDSFEQLAAQAAAQLGVVPVVDPGPVERACAESPWNGTRSDPAHPVSTKMQYSNVPSTHFTSTPGLGARTPSIPGGVSVLPTSPPQQLNQYQQQTHPAVSSASTTSMGDEASDFRSWMDSQLNTDLKDPWSNSSGYLPSHNDIGKVSGVSDYPNQTGSSSYAQDRSPSGVVCPNRVSEKIQQLVNTLKRPKRRPLPEYFLDEEDQILVRQVTDPAAPRPRGPPSQPLRGEELLVPSGLPRNLESALQRYAGLSCKTPVMTCLDVCGRPTQVLTYAKLLQVSRTCFFNPAFIAIYSDKRSAKTIIYSPSIRSLCRYLWRRGSWHNYVICTV
ncbi:Disco-interacting protein 2 B-A [Fasciola hepatica]|uniref:Disco-interacting protein 2 B-A n=1 Tax=Fasciola hepatica TaxID=6192 RepID=A0A4E0QVS9_FASHE|nr:Disco-interacting protein 2 B-A [Fasciola hepatica]